MARQAESNTSKINQRYLQLTALSFFLVPFCSQVCRRLTAITMEEQKMAVRAIILDMEPQLCLLASPPLI